MARILLIMIFLFQHSVMAAQGIVLHLPDDSHELLLSVEQPHSHGLHHDHHDEEHDEADSVALALNDSPDNSTPHDSAAHEHPSHVHLAADVPAQPYSSFYCKNGSERYVHNGQLIGITHTPPVPPPNV